MSAARRHRRRRPHDGGIDEADLVTAARAVARTVGCTCDPDAVVEADSDHDRIVHVDLQHDAACALVRTTRPEGTT